MDDKANILIVDEDVNNFTAANEFFHSLGANMILVSDTHKVLSLLESEKFNLAFVSLNFAYTKKWNFLKYIKGNIHPIIGLLDNASSGHMVEGLTYGFDAYMVKPLDSLNLRIYLPITLSYIWSNKDYSDLNTDNERRGNYDRRSYRYGKRWYDQLKHIQFDLYRRAVFKIGPFEIDNSQKIIYLEGKKIVLSPKEFQLFRLLTSNLERVLSAEEIISHIWPNNERASEEDVKQFVYLLRKKIEPDTAHPQYLHTAKGFGYIMNFS